MSETSSRLLELLSLLQARRDWYESEAGPDAAPDTVSLALERVT